VLGSVVGAIGANVVEHKVEGHKKKKHSKYGSDGGLRPERHGHHHHHKRHGSRSRSRGIDGSGSSSSDSD
jgi:hypothetical protein